MAAPTITEIFDEMIDFADFEEAASVSRAKGFVTAAKRYLLAAPQSQADQGSSMTLSVSQIENLLKRAIDYTAAHSVERVSFLNVGAKFR